MGAVSFAKVDGTLQVFIEVIDAEDTQNSFDGHDQIAFLVGDRQP